MPSRDGIRTVRTDIPWAKAGLARFVEKFPNKTEEEYKYVESAVSEFFNQELDNVELFETGEGTSFPYTSIHLNRVARALYEKHIGTCPPLSEHPTNYESPHRKIEIVMGSFLATNQGHPFGYCEEALHKIMMALPTALEAIHVGREPERIEIITLGSPTNEVAEMSGDFAERMNNDSAKALGALYAGLAEKVLRAEEARGTDLALTGFSMGGNFAVEVAQELLRKRLVTQDRKALDKPHMAVTMYLPVGLNDSLLRSAQIAGGFGVEAVAQVVAGSPDAQMISRGEAQFALGVRELIQKRKAEPIDESPQQVVRKRKALQAIVRSVLFTPPDVSGLRVDKVTGVYDWTTRSGARTREYGERTGIPESEQTLGTRILGRKDPMHRDHVASMRHLVPFFRESEMLRWSRVSLKIKKLLAKS